MIGDSKTDAGWPNVWPANLVASLNATTPYTWIGANVGHGGTSVASWSVPGAVASYCSGPPQDYVIIDLGVNDFGSLPSEATFEAQYWYILDQVRLISPYALIYVCKPWKAGSDADADTVAGWIDTIVAGRSFARPGWDERVWVKGSDNGATMTVDGIHFCPGTTGGLTPGEIEAAIQGQTILGY